MGLYSVDKTTGALSLRSGRGDITSLESRVAQTEEVIPNDASATYQLLTDNNRWKRAVNGIKSISFRVSNTDPYIIIKVTASVYTTNSSALYDLYFVNNTLIKSVTLYDNGSTNVSFSMSTSETTRTITIVCSNLSSWSVQI